MKKIIFVILLSLTPFFLRAQIVAGEYFFDTDPGIGHGTAFSFAAGTNATASISTAGLAPGAHYLYIRVKDNNGTWSHYEGRSFFVCENLPEIPVITGSPIVCQNHPLALSGNPVTDATSYYWEGPNGFTQTGNDLPIDNIQPNHAGTYVFYAVRTGGTSCDTSKTKTEVVVNTSPAPVITENEGALVTTESFETYEWIYNGASTGTVSQSYTDIQPGSYQVVVTDTNGCSDTSEVYRHLVTGPQLSKTDLSSILIYPNPATDQITIEYPDANYQISISDLAGHTHLHQSAAGTTQLYIGSLAQGTYLLKIYKNGILKGVRKITKQ